jgi:hypothetical protein
MNKMIKYIAFLFFITQCFCDASVNLDFENKEGIQLYYVADSNYFLFATLIGDENKISIKLNLFTADNLDTIDKSNGIWAGIGFGSSVMDKSDMVVFTYTKANGGACTDYWGIGNKISKDVDLGGNDDLTYLGLLATSTNTLPYSASYSWTCEKSLTALDSYDWSDFKNWMTNKGKTIAAIGALGKDGQIMQHKFSSGPIEIVDGVNLPELPDELLGSYTKFSLAFLMVLMIIFF